MQRSLHQSHWLRMLHSTASLGRSNQLLSITSKMLWNRRKSCLWRTRIWRYLERYSDCFGYPRWRSILSYRWQIEISLISCVWSKHQWWTDWRFSNHFNSLEPRRTQWLHNSRRKLHRSLCWKQNTFWHSMFCYLQWCPLWSSRTLHI